MKYYKKNDGKLSKQCRKYMKIMQNIKKNEMQNLKSKYNTHRTLKNYIYARKKT